MVLSTPGRFIKLDVADDGYFHVTNARLLLKGKAATIVHKTSQIIIDIYNFKLRKEATLGSQSTSAIAELHKASLGDGTGSKSGATGAEDRTAPSTIEATTVVYKKVSKGPV